MKICTKCKEMKPFDDFHKNKRSSDGLKECCRECVSVRHKQYRTANSGKISAINRAWYEVNRGKELAKKKVYHIENREKIHARSKAWYKQHRSEAIKRQTAFHTRVREATPKWLTDEQKNEIKRLYDHARECSIIMGERYVVDHIFPLKGENLCGLHIPINLEVVPYWYNGMKGKRFDPEEGIVYEAPSS